MSNVKWPHRAYSEAVGVPVHHGKMKETDKAWLVEYEKCHTALRDLQLANSFLSKIRVNPRPIRAGSSHRR